MQGLLNLFTAAVLLAFSLLALNAWGNEEEFFTIASREVELIQEGDLTQPLLKPSRVSHKMKAESTSFGEILIIAKELVALGEDIYNLVSKGKPQNTANYAPISVIPLVDGKPADVFETEGWSNPVSRTYKISFKNLYGIQTVKFTYSVIFSFGGSYKGKGLYLTSAQIIPESIETLWGYNVDATMRLGGVQNHGSKASPTAGATLLLEYSVKTLMKAVQYVDKFHVRGDGEYKAF